jgi:hypothetical protein
MRMATGRRRRRWIVACGATAAVAIGIGAAAAYGAPSLSAPSPTNALPQLTWGADGATSYDVGRESGACTQAPNFTTIATGAPSPFPDNTSPPLVDGLYCYQVTGHGYMDGDESSQVSVLLDRVAPSVQITSPVAGYVKGTVQIQASASDASSGLASITISIPGQTITNPKSTTSPVTASWPTPAAGGTFTVTATAVDKAGNTATDSVQVTADNTPPQAPNVFAQTPVAGSPTLVWNAVPGESYTISRDTAQVATGLTAGQWTDPATLQPGTYAYVVTAIDGAGNATASQPLSVTVIPVSVTAPRSISADSPTNVLPHIVWQPPVTFPVLNYQVFRNGSPLLPMLPATALSFDDTTIPGQGSYTYTVQAVDGGLVGDASSPVSVTYDTVAPILPLPSAVSNPDGSISINWAAATDPDPGSGVANYIVRRGGQNAPPASPSAGTAVCTVVVPAPTGCIDSATQNDTNYSYSVFAIDGASNVTRQWVSARAVDTVPPDPVSGFHASVGPTSAHLMWNLPDRKGANADIVGYRIIQLSQGKTKPANPKDGAQVCPGLDYTDGDCFVTHLIQGRKTTFAIYAYDAVPNYSAPAVVTVIPKGDNSKPHAPKKVRVRRVGARIIVTWVSPKDPDLSHFVLTLNASGPVRAPTAGHLIFKGRKLQTSFTLKAGQITYANLFSLDLSGNYSPRVYRLIVMPDRLAVPKSKHKAGKKTPPKKPLAATTKKKS